MVELTAILLPLLLVDVLNPVLFAMLVFAAGSSRPIANSAWMLLGHTLAYFAAGIVVALSIERLAEYFANPNAMDFAVGGAVGLGLLWMVLRTKRSGGPKAVEPKWNLTPFKCLVFGMVVSFVGVPFALPYFAVVDQIAKAGLITADALAVLALYNLAYALPFAIVPVMIAATGETAKPFLERLNGMVARVAELAMPWMLGLVGLILVADSLSYFLRGQGLW